MYRWLKQLAANVTMLPKFHESSFLQNVHMPEAVRKSMLSVSLCSAQHKGPERHQPAGQGQDMNTIKILVIIYINKIVIISRVIMLPPKRILRAMSNQSDSKCSMLHAVQVIHSSRGSLTTGGAGEQALL